MTGWRKSSYSNGNPINACVEVNMNWRKSSHGIGNGQCVEVAELDGRLIGVRDSRDPDGPVLAFDWGTDWQEFTHAIKAGWRPLG